MMRDFEVTPVRWRPVARVWWAFSWRLFAVLIFPLASLLGLEDQEAVGNRLLVLGGALICVGPVALRQALTLPYGDLVVGLIEDGRLQLLYDRSGTATPLRWGQTFLCCERLADHAIIFMGFGVLLFLILGLPLIDAGFGPTFSRVALRDSLGSALVTLVVVTWPFTIGALRLLFVRDIRGGRRLHFIRRSTDSSSVPDAQLTPAEVEA